MKKYSTSIERTCLACGAGFFAGKTDVEKGWGKYCSNACRYKSNPRTHGHTAEKQTSRTYLSWTNMRARCLNPNSPKYPMYGGAGITICDRWSSFDNFLEDMGERPLGTTIDRIDGKLGYEKENCRWATRIEQQNNLSTNRLITVSGETKTLCEWAREKGISQDTLRHRAVNNWSDDQIFSKPNKGASAKKRGAIPS